MCNDIGASAREIMIAIVSIDIHYKPKPRQKLAFERRFPSIQIGGVIGNDRSAVVGIAKEGITPGRNLRQRHARGCQKQQNSDPLSSHMPSYSSRAIQ